MKRYNNIVIHRKIECHYGEGEMNMDSKLTTHVEYDVNKLSVRLWQLRNQQCMTVEALAEKVDVSTRFITQIESGERYGSIQTLILIANALDITLGSLFE